MTAPNIGATERIGKFWKSGEGTAAMAVTALLGSGLLLLLYKALPYIIILFKNLITATSLLIGLSALAFVLAGLVYFLTRKDLWIAYSYFCENQARRIKKLVVDTDPINTAKTALVRMRRRLEDMRTHARHVVANRKRIEEMVRHNNEERENYLHLAKKALEQGEREQADGYAATAMDYQESNESLMPTLRGLDWLQKVLEKASKSLGVKIDGFDRKILIKEREFKAKLAGQAAVNAARTALTGDDKAMFDESMDSISQQISMAEASVEEFFSDMLPVFQAEDMGKAVKNEKARAAMERWLHGQDKNPDAFTLIPSNDAKQLLLEGGMATPVAAVQEPVAAVSPQPGEYGAFFERR